MITYPDITRFQVNSVFDDEDDICWKVELSHPVKNDSEVWERLWDFIQAEGIEYKYSVMDYYGDVGLQAYDAGEATPENFPKITALLKQFLISENLFGSEKIEPWVEEE